MGQPRFATPTRPGLRAAAVPSVGLALCSVSLLGILSCRGASPTALAPSPSTAPPTESPTPAGPLPSTVTGATISAYHGTPVVGATVAFDGFAPVTTDARGAYTIVIPDAESHRVVVEAPGHQYRETYVRPGISRELVFDLIPNDGSFPLGLFRHIARNGFEQPGNLQPLQRWTINPKVHIETLWRDTGAAVDGAALQYIVAEIRRAVPHLTDGRLEVAGIEVGPERWDFVDGYISVHFDHAGNYGTVGQNPGQVQFGTASPCTSIMVVHEFGHALGLWHSGVKPSVMGGMPILDCNPVTLTPDEQQVVRVLYNRPVGNVEPDRDPNATLLSIHAGATTAGARAECESLHLAEDAFRVSALPSKG